MKSPEANLLNVIRDTGLEPIIANENVILLSPLPAFWNAFEQSAISKDGKDDPLDRYSKTQIQPLAKNYQLEACFPSDGPPYPPFIAWANEAPSIQISPIGLLVHEDFGLWVSFRGALIGKHNLPLPQAASPCQNCEAPCLSACPVHAFSQGRYNVEACKSAISRNQVPCISGCLARQSCTANHLPRDKAQSEFHMKAFMK